MRNTIALCRRIMLPYQNVVSSKYPTCIPVEPGKCCGKYDEGTQNLMRTQNANCLGSNMITCPTGVVQMKSMVECSTRRKIDWCNWSDALKVLLFIVIIPGEKKKNSSKH